MRFRHVVLVLFILLVGGVLTLIGKAKDEEHPVFGPLGLAWETSRRAGSLFSYDQPRLGIRYTDEEEEAALPEFLQRRAALEGQRSATGGLLIDGARARPLRWTMRPGWSVNSPFNPALHFVALGPAPAAVYYLPERREYAVLGRVRVEPYLEEVTDAVLDKYGEPLRPLVIPTVETP